MKLTKSQIKELIRHSIRELTSEREDVTESKKRRLTVKEVRMWMKKLEENRYKKVYNSDARRVAWMVNNEGRTLDEMPISMKKKWTKAQYGRERYLATEFLKSKSEQMNEVKIPFSSSHIKQLKRAFKDMKGTLPDNNPLVQQIVTLLKKTDKKVLKQIASADIKYLSDKAKDILGEGVNSSLVKKMIKAVNKGEDVVVYDKKGKKYSLQSGDNKAVAVTDYLGSEKTYQTLPMSKVKKIVIEGKLTSEQKLRESIREIIKEQLNLNEYIGAGKPIPRNKAKQLFVPEKEMIRFSRVFKKLIQKGFVYIGDQAKEKKKIKKHYTITVDKKMYNNLLDILMSKRFKVKT